MQQAKLKLAVDNNIIYKGPFTRVDWVDEHRKPRCDVFPTDDEAKQFINSIHQDSKIPLALKACVRFTSHWHLMSNDPT